MQPVTTKPAEWGTVPPSAVPTVGSVLSLDAGDWRYHRGDESKRLVVRRVRLDISPWYDGEWVWIDGAELTEDGAETETEIQVLVRIGSLPETALDPEHQPN